MGMERPTALFLSVFMASGLWAQDLYVLDKEVFAFVTDGDSFQVKSTQWIGPGPEGPILLERIPSRDVTDYLLAVKFHFEEGPSKTAYIDKTVLDGVATQITFSTTSSGPLTLESPISCPLEDTEENLDIILPEEGIFLAKTTLPTLLPSSMVPRPPQAPPVAPSVSLPMLAPVAPEVTEAGPEPEPEPPPPRRGRYHALSPGPRDEGVRVYNGLRSLAEDMLEDEVKGCLRALPTSKRPAPTCMAQSITDSCYEPYGFYNRPSFRCLRQEVSSRCYDNFRDEGNLEDLIPVWRCFARAASSCRRSLKDWYRENSVWKDLSKEGRAYRVMNLIEEKLALLRREGILHGELDEGMVACMVRQEAGGSVEYYPEAVNYTFCERDRNRHGSPISSAHGLGQMTSTTFYYGRSQGYLSLTGPAPDSSGYE